MRFGRTGIILAALFIAGTMAYCVASEHTIRVAVIDGTTEEPVEGAVARFNFRRVLSPGEGWGAAPPEVVERRTDARGYASARGRIDDYRAWVNVVADGYYLGGAGFDLSSQSDEFTYDINERAIVRLRKKHNPVPMYARRFQGQSLRIPTVGEDLGFDLQVSDWVAPHGKGVQADIIFHMIIGEEHGELFPMEYGATGMRADVSVAVTFPEGGGIMTLKSLPYSDSAFRWPYLAPEEGYADSYFIRWDFSPGDPALATRTWRQEAEYKYIIKTRPAVDPETGKTIFSYGRLESPVSLLSSRRDPRKVYLEFAYLFNPIPGERSLEFDVTQNLFRRMFQDGSLGGFTP